MKRYKGILISVIVMGIVVLVVLRLLGSKAMLDEELKSMTEYSALVPVEVTAVVTGYATQSITESGIFNPLKEVAILSETQGIVLSVSCAVGDFVQKGQVLVAVERSLLEKQLALAELSLANAQTDLQRFEALANSEAITQQQLEGAKLGYQNALTNVASLKEQIDNTIITAPFDGYVTSRSIELGALMVPGMPVMSIAQQNDLLFCARLSERDVLRVAIGMPVAITADAYNGEQFSGKVKEVGVSATQSGRYEVLVQIPNSQFRLRSGMGGRATFIFSSNEQQLVIPRKSLVGSVLSPSIFVLEGDSVVLRTIRVNPINEEVLVVISGLKEGERVITSGQINLEQGTKVRVLNPV